jgi:hypothetical protein
MIKLDPFYILLMLEILLIQSGLLIFLFLKSKKGRSSQEGTQLQPEPLTSVEAIPDAPKSPPTEEKKNEPKIVDPIGNDDFSFLTDEAIEGKTAEKEPGTEQEPAIKIKRLEQTIEEKVEVILELKNKIQEMEKKFDSVENEYQILFDQSQKQEEALRAYEKGGK